MTDHYGTEENKYFAKLKLEKLYEIFLFLENCIGSISFKKYISNWKKIIFFTNITRIAYEAF